MIEVETTVLPAYEVTDKKVARWWVWCKHYRGWHIHGPGDGHREAHCSGAESPYFRGWYNISLAGKMTRSVAEMVKRDRTRD